ncbi:TM2 domain-containing protein [Gordonia sp. CPCC 205515]|uniref:TM2 domain-containing protein n=1 Tax=Gordonia sp. CPCC 205515 TaxID=3140791 RepID=UPI003AF404C4
MTNPYGGDPMGQEPWRQQYPPAPGYGFPPQPDPAFGYPPNPYGMQPFVDPMAPYGRDPFTGEALSDKSKVVAGLLQIFLGTLGIGRFYLGHTTIGAIQLALTVFGFLTMIFLIGFVLLAAVGIWALIDGILILTGSVPDSRGLKLRP